MKRLWVTVSLVFFCLVLFSSQSAPLAAPSPGQLVNPTPGTLDAASDPLWYPKLTLPHDTTLRLCGADSICYQVKGSDPDANETLVLTLLQGPISFAPDTFHTNFSITVCFRPDTSGTFRFIWQLKDKYNQITKDTVTYCVQVNHPPTISDQTFGTELCYQATTRSLPVVASDPDHDKLRYVLLSGGGTIDSTTGVITYLPTASGSYSFEVAVYDQCSGDTATIRDTVTINQPPSLSWRDSSLYLCSSEEVCLNLTGVDPEGGSVGIALVEGPGTITMTSDRTASLCFTPTQDSATYQFVVCLTDQCPFGSQPGTASIPICFRDTINVSVKLDRPPVIDCPGPQEFSSCDTGTFCFPITATDPDGGEVILSILSGNATLQGSDVCVSGAQSTSTNVVIEARDECGHADTCMVPVTINANRAPVITSAADFSMSVCQSEKICVQVRTNDPDGDSLTITSNFGAYEKAIGSICFTADTSGIYRIIATAKDSCGATAMDTTNVDVTVNHPPIVHFENDFDTLNCSNGELCFNVSVSDENLKNAYTSFGVYNPQAGTVCFTPDSSGTYVIVVTAVDYCGAKSSDTLHVTVGLNQPPVVQFDKKYDSLGCYSGELCYGVSVTDDNITNVTVNYGSYDSRTGRVCFTPDTTGTYTIILSATDQCELTAADTMQVKVGLNISPAVAFDKKYDSVSCYLGELCYKATVTDDGPTDVVASFGSYSAETGEVCFTPDTSGLYTIVLTATDGCGEVAADTLQVKADVNHPPAISGFHDTTVYLCKPANICLPISITDADGNIDSITVSRGKYADGSVCFVPYDSGTYSIVVNVLDKCGEQAVDTAVVTVKTDQQIVIDWPKDTSIFVCQPEQLCFPVRGIPTDASVKVIGTNVTWDAEKQAVCFFSDCCLSNTITVEVTTACGLILRGTFTVNVQTNSKPLVMMPHDTSVALCASGTLCFPVGISDVDKNISSVDVSGGTYDAQRGTICLQPDTTGTYAIVVNVTDSCGAGSTAQMNVHVRLNHAPNVQILTADTLYQQCVPQQICLPVQTSDPDSEAVTVRTSMGTYNPTSGEICFTPPGAGRYCITAIATDACGAADTSELCVTVATGDFVQIACPDSSFNFSICGPDTICVPLEISGNYARLTTSLGTYSDGRLCFVADSSGTYTAQVIADAGCNSDTCNVTARVNVQQPVSVACGVPNVNVLLCKPFDTLQIPVSITGVPESILVSPSYVHYADGFVYVPVGLPGQPAEFTVRVTVENSCYRDSCSFPVVVQHNVPPTLTLGPDTTVKYCGQIPSISLPFTVHDPDNNLEGVSTSLGTISGSEIVFQPTDSGTYRIVLTAMDSCGSNAIDTMIATYIKLDSVSLACPPPIVGFTINLPDTVRIPLGVSPAGTNVTVLPMGYYDVVNGEIVAYVTSDGTYDFTVSAAGECNSDSCRFQLEINQYMPPVVDCRGTVDTLLCVSGVDTVCLPVTISGTNPSVEVSAPAYYADGHVCIPVTGPGNYDIRIIASDSAMADTCTTSLVVRGGGRPVVTLPADFTVRGCGQQEVCVDASVSDSQNDLSLIEATGGTYDASAGKLCFTATAAGVHQVILTATDSCGLVGADTVNVTVVFNQPPTVSLGSDTSLFVCAGAEVCLPVNVSDPDANLMSVNAIGATYDAASKTVCFTPAASGSIAIIVTAVDSCNAQATDTLNVTVQINRPPTISNFRDTSVYICSPKNICLPIAVLDPDSNLASVTVNRGSYSNGTVCFVPYDSGRYQIIVTATDKCGLTAVDTASVTVKTDQQVVIGWPKDTSVFVCEPTQLCFPVTGIPSDAKVKVIGTNVSWDAQKQAVCFFSDCCLSNAITIEVTTACGMIVRGTFTASIQTNSKPLVILARDTTITQCEPGQICLPVGVSDQDRNLVSVTATGGVYDAQRGTICFTTTGAGTYTVSVTATDACGATSSDQQTVTVRMNSKPAISFTSDSVFTVCGFTETCLPVTVSDLDNNLKSISVSKGTYDAQSGRLCFTPTDTGRTYIAVVATDSCGMLDSAIVSVIFRLGSAVSIECPTSPIPAVELCKPDSICLDLPIVGSGFDVSTSAGRWNSNRLCFMADSSGTYGITVIASSLCGGDTCRLSVPVTILPAVEVACPGSDSVFLCGPDTLCYTFTTSSSVQNVRVVGPAYITGQQVCVPVFEAGVINVKLIGEGSCGADTCAFSVTAAFNRPPSVSLGRDSVMTVCSLPQICIPVVKLDPDNNIRSVSANIGQITGNGICFTPTSYGVYDIIATVEDSCGALDKDTVRYTVNKGDTASITCPDGDQFASVCGPDSVRIAVPITPSTATVRVLPSGSYNKTTGKVSVFANQAGTYAVTVIADAACSSDTCNFNINVTMSEKPKVVCPGSIDDTLCLVSPDTICFPVTVTGTGVSVVVSPSGYYTAGAVCLPVSAAGTYDVKIKATGTCGEDSCTTTVNVTDNKTPQLFLPGDLTYDRCPQDNDSIVIDGISAKDAEGPIAISKICGPGIYTAVRVDSGKVTFLPGAFGPVDFCFQVTDGCHTVLDTLHVTINEKPDCDVCARVTVDGGPCTPVGMRQRVNFNIETNQPIGGFDLLVAYDASAIAFQTATIQGTAISGWEYFTYHVGNGNCGSSCPSGLVRFVGLADINNGAHHPPLSSLSPNGVLIGADFQLSSDQNLGGQFVPINFVWYDCGDNTFADTTGSQLMIDRRIYNAEHTLIWDETDDANYPETSRPFGVGAPDACTNSGAKVEPTRCVEFIEGGICIVHPDSIDARGDINLNGLAYEIADAVLFTNYFIHGIRVFTINVAGQVAATDVNADGLTLTVADLTYLIRVIIGDAPAVPKIVPYAEKLRVSTDYDPGVISISTSAISNIGSAYIVCDVGPNAVIDTPRLADAARDMNLAYALEDGKLRMLIYDIGKNFIAAGTNRILEIPFTGDPDVKVSYSEITDYDGQPYQSTTVSRLVPDNFILNQNYPNPFNPSTQISFGLPHASSWTLRIYNVAGSLVREFNGSASAGTVNLVWDGTSNAGTQVASGVYLYRLDAGAFSETKKMILLK